MRIDKNNVHKLSRQAQLALLKKLLEKLDDLDGEDFFGTEGWRHLLLGED